jgi:flagellum-specific peptidoglycan hydrolase FlgJ
MRKKLNQQLFVYLLILSLDKKLGFYFKHLNNDSKAGSVEHSQESTEPVLSNNLIAASSESPSPDPIAVPIALPIPSSNPIPTETGAPINKAEESPAALPNTQTQTVESPAVAKEESNTYEVTAYFLNVRTKPSAKSSIIKVVEQGTTLKVTAVADNGWLELQDGGYIHGGYAKEVKEKGKVSILSLPAASNRQPTNAFNDSSMERALQSESIDEEAVEEQGEEEELSKPTSIVKSDSGLTEEHISKIFEGTALSGHDLEQAILEIEEEYGINAYFTIAVMKLESGNGKSRLAKSKNNLFGLNAIDGDKYNKAFSFKTKGDSVRKFGQLLSKNYVGKGLTTIEKVARKYCPANSKWSGLVKNIMKSDYRKL